jgi:hypothetical protein
MVLVVVGYFGWVCWCGCWCGLWCVVFVVFLWCGWFLVLVCVVVGWGFGVCVGCGVFV